MSLIRQILIEDPDGVGQAVINDDGMFGTVDAGYLIAKGLATESTPFTKIGYNPAVTTTEETVWSAGGSYVFPTAEQQMEVVSSDNTQDIGTVIKGDATGNTVISDADGTLTTLEDDDVDFTAATSVAVGDCIILDPHGTTPEFGFVTAVAAHTLTCTGGFSSGGTGASRYYAVIDESASTAAQAVMISYLDNEFAMHREVVILNGTTAVNTVNTDIYRINGIAVICGGSTNVTLGNVSLKNTAGTITYGHITAGYTVARQLVFTVPAGKTIYITQVNVAASAPNDSKVQSCRIIIRTNTIPDSSFRGDGIFYPKGEFAISNASEAITLNIPLKVVEKSDIIVDAQGFTGFSGPVVSILRGFLLTNS